MKKDVYGKTLKTPYIDLEKQYDGLWIVTLDANTGDYRDNCRWSFVKRSEAESFVNKISGNIKRPTKPAPGGRKP